MPRQKIEKGYWSYGQVSQYFGFGKDLVEQLVADGELVGLDIPSRGRKAQVRLVSIASVREAEERWQVNGGGEKRRRRKPAGGVQPALRHFPELREEATVDRSSS